MQLFSTSKKLSRSPLRSAVRLAAVGVIHAVVGQAVWIEGAIAHNVEVAGEIAGTWHVEPDHNPKAGEPAKVWVALTRQGGEVLPFDQADCQMKVYEVPRAADAVSIMEPGLRAIAAEQYQGIPGTDLVFPKPGIYQLELSCSPKTEGAFTAFTMDSEVTVAAGSSPVTAASPAPVVQLPDAVSSAAGVLESSEPGGWQGLVVGTAIATVLGLGLLKLMASRMKK
jgi:hypothetical protein